MPLPKSNLKRYAVAVCMLFRLSSCELATTPPFPRSTVHRFNTTESQGEKSDMGKHSDTQLAMKARSSGRSGGSTTKCAHGDIDIVSGGFSAVIRGRSFGHPQTQSCTISSGWARLKTPAALGQSSQSMWKRGHRKTALALSRPRESPRNSELHYFPVLWSSDFAIHSAWRGREECVNLVGSPTSRQVPSRSRFIKAVTNYPSRISCGNSGHTQTLASVGGDARHGTYTSCLRFCHWRCT